MLAKKPVMDHCVVKFDLYDLIEISFKFSSLIFIIFEVIIIFFKSVAKPPLLNSTLTEDNIK